MPDGYARLCDRHHRSAESGFSIGLDALNEFPARNPGAKLELQGRSAAQASKKPVRANATMSGR